MTKKSAEYIFQPGITGRFLDAGPLNSLQTFRIRDFQNNFENVNNKY